MNSCYFHTCGGNVSPRVAIRYRGKIHSCSEVNVYWRKFHGQANVPDSLLYTQFVVFMWLPSTRWVQWCNHITYENNTAARPVVYQYMYILCLANIHICSNTTKWLFNLWRMSAKKHYRSIKMITQLNWGKGKELGEEREKEKKEQVISIQREGSFIEIIIFSLQVWVLHLFHLLYQYLEKKSRAAENARKKDKEEI